MSEPVAVVFRRRAKSGREHEYEAWLDGLQRETRGTDGYLGVTTMRQNGAYVSIVRFASVDALAAWEASEVRARWLAKLPHDAVDGEAEVQRLEGVEGWFTAPGMPVLVQPVRWKMALVLVFVVYGLILGLGPIVGFVVGDVPFPLRLLLTVMVEVTLMTWVVMPVITRALRGWLFAK